MSQPGDRFSSARPARLAPFLALLSAVGLCAVGCGPKTSSETPVVGPTDTPAGLEKPSVDELGAATGVDDSALAALLVEHWDAEMAANPVTATTRGDHRFDDQLGDYSDAAIQKRLEQSRAFLARAKGIEATGLSDRDVVTLKLFISSLESSTGISSCEAHLWAISAFTNPVKDANRLPELHRVGSATDADNLLARYRQIPTMVDRWIANLRVGAKRGLYANAESVRALSSKSMRCWRHQLRGGP